MAALSIATDLGMGQPLEMALCSCVVAMRLGEALNLDGETRRDVYYLAGVAVLGTVQTHLTVCTSPPLVEAADCQATPV